MKTQATITFTVLIAGLVVTLPSGWAQPATQLPVARVPRPAVPGNATNVTALSKTFVFGGGSLDSFIRTVEQQLGLDMNRYADFPRTDAILNMRVPKLRCGSMTFYDVAALYNHVSEEGGGYLGKWVVRGPGVDGVPNAVVFIPPQRMQSLAVRAFALKGRAKVQAGVLVDLIRNEHESLLRRTAELGTAESADARGEVHLAAEGQILVATGGAEYLEMVQALVDAFREKAAEIEPPSAKGSAAKPER